MAKKHPDDRLAFTYRIKSPEVWAAIRAEWEAGATFAALSRRFEVGEATIRARRLSGRWTRAAPLERLTSPACVEITPLAIAESALARSVEALAQGRASDALALIKAGDAIGAFADFVARLRAGETGPPVPTTDTALTHLGGEA